MLPILTGSMNTLLSTDENMLVLQRACRSPIEVESIIRKDGFVDYELSRVRFGWNLFQSSQAANKCFFEPVVGAQNCEAENRI